MGKHLSTEDIEDVVRLLDGWTGKLTWPALCKACKPIIGTAPTRQTLMKFSRVSTAFKLSKNSRATLEAPPSFSPSVYAQRIFRLQQENQRLAKENQQLLHQFITWQYNAYAGGLVESDLNRPLPTPGKVGATPAAKKRQNPKKKLNARKQRNLK